jgi:putative membrane protein
MILGHAGVDHVAFGVAAAAAIAGYGAAWIHQPRRTAWRLLAWTTGIASIGLATAPPTESLAESRFTGHMVQHLLLIAVAAPLLVTARPVRAVTAAGWIPTTAAGRRLGATWRRGAPVLGPLALVAVLFVTHLTSVYDRALHERWVHEVEHAAYLLSAMLAWAAVAGGRRSSAVARIAAVFGIGVSGAVLGIALLSAGAPLVPTYEARLGPAALSDQRSAAALMWVTGFVTTLPLLVIAVWRWASAEERITRHAEALAASEPDRTAGSTHLGAAEPLAALRRSTAAPRHRV